MPLSSPPKTPQNTQNRTHGHPHARHHHKSPGFCLSTPRHTSPRITAQRNQKKEFMPRMPPGITPYLALSPLIASAQLIFGGPAQVAILANHRLKQRISTRYSPYGASHWSLDGTGAAAGGCTYLGKKSAVAHKKRSSTSQQRSTRRSHPHGEAIRDSAHHRKWSGTLRQHITSHP